MLKTVIAYRQHALCTVKPSHNAVRTMLSLLG
jgi:hypothetical protein